MPGPNPDIPTGNQIYRGFIDESGTESEIAFRLNEKGTGPTYLTSHSPAPTALCN